MNMEEIRNKIENMNLGKILYNEPMKNHTTFKIGGPADIVIIPTTEEELIKSVKFCRENQVEFMIMGNGSNLLVKDGGIRGIVIKIGEGFNAIKIENTTVFCEAGALLSEVSNAVLEHSLQNFEFASGIPGTIGGAITMNAGAYGGEMKDVVANVRVLDNDNNVRTYETKDMNFRYRNSRVGDEGLIVLSIELSLESGDYNTIDEKIKELTHKRKSKQPLEFPSGGSTFKRPEGYFAGKLIEDSGLCGLRHRGAMVSDKHCGFVINKDNANCSDVLHLISVIQKVVKDKYDVVLETEIKIIGED